MSGSNWHTVKGVDRGALSEARLQAHYATQWLAKTARACVMTRPDEHHTNLGWDDAFGGLITHPLPQGSVLGLRISDLTLLLWDGSRLAGAPSIGLEGRNDSDIRQWLGRQLSQKGLDAGALDAPSPYRMPEHAIGHGAPYGFAQSPAKLVPALAELAAWFANASRVLGETRQRIVGRGIDAPPVRCWPHHFDLDSLIALPAGAGTVGLGFCPGDDYYDQPYFYVSRHPAPDVAALAPLPPVGHWHTHHFTAAVAVADRIVAGGDPQAATEAFLRAATDILIP